MDWKADEEGHLNGWPFLLLDWLESAHRFILNEVSDETPT